MRRMTIIVLMCLFALVSAPLLIAVAQETTLDLQGIKTYLLKKAIELQASAKVLHISSDAYYQLAAGTKFDYAVLWEDEATKTAKTLQIAKDAWIEASPLYEQIEGVVAGVPSLSEFDVILDAGTSAADDPESAVPFDLTLPDGRVLEKPGNLFGLLETTLWGTRAEFVAVEEVDLDANGTVEFGEVLPEANMLKGTAEAMLKYTSDLVKAAEGWEPNTTDAFTALVVMIPTMSEYFESWKQSRFVAGDASQQAEFAVISRLSDIQDILSGLQVVYDEVSPLVLATDKDRAERIGQSLTDLRAYVADLYKQEQEGKRFTAEEADLLGSEAQTRAEGIVGEITQIAALLNIPLPE